MCQAALNVALPCRVHPVCAAPVFSIGSLYVCVFEREEGGEGSENPIEDGFQSMNEVIS